ncbi:MAG: PSD1 and planctomycete cytochrome C domain-containing protein [Verrucomicrobiota bacterium]
MTTRFSLSLAFASAATLSPCVLRAAPAPVSFNRDIRPIMSNTCFHCHGFDAKSRKGGLRLDIREEALKPAKSGDLPIVPGKPEESAIIRRIFATDHDDLMPPEEEHKPLTGSQKETFRRWVAEGAKYEAHWAYTPLVKPELPAVKDARWSRNEIDTAVRAVQESQGLTPSAQADRRTLIRRVSLDLIGLPPSPEEVDAFLADTSPGAYDRLVDRLLASPHFGERMAVGWLDVVRFTDTVGYHGDQNQRIFPYRDYVIDAFNRNKPFDQFTREQLAGDLLPNPTETQLTATGFNRLNMVTREGGAQAAEYLAKYGADRTRVVAATWLGSTFGCAECHDHKFDPISTKDFYSLQAFFADVKQWGVYSPYSSSPNEELAGFNNDSPFPPEREVTSQWLLDKAARAEADRRILVAETAAKRALDPTASAAFETWLKDSREFLKRHPGGWALPAFEKPAEPPAAVAASTPPSATVTAAAPTPNPTPAPAAAPAFTMADNGRISVPPGKSATLALKMKPGAGTVAALCLEVYTADGKTTPSGHVALSAKLQRPGQKEEKVTFRFADSKDKKPRYADGEEIPGTLGSWTIGGAKPGISAEGVWLIDRPLTLGADDVLTVTLKDNALTSFRLSVSPFAAPVLTKFVEFMAPMAAALEKPEGANLSLVNEAWLTSTAADAAAYDQYQTLAALGREYRDGRTMTLVTQAMQPLTVKVRPRGNWQDESGPVTPPATPHFLPGPKPAEGQRLSRLDLANWLCSPENPLTARTVMNRLWKQFFGNGLSAVVDDLGAQGEPPSHPELLDWLAAEFRDKGWDTKHMVRLIVTSATYRQASNQRPEYRDLDPSNRLLTFQNPRRLEAEFVRDNALEIAGLLNLDVGGPSAHPYQPAGYYANLQFPDREYQPDKNADQWRRGVYMHWQRTFLHPMLANFDAPMRDECAAARMVSNTPQQALTLLNDPTFAEAARVFARHLLTSPAKTDADRFLLAWHSALAREPRPQELSSITTFLAQQRETFHASPADAAKVEKIGFSPPPPAGQDPVELAAWTSVCRVILNLHETITRY